MLSVCYLCEDIRVLSVCYLCEDIRVLAVCYLCEDIRLHTLQRVWRKSRPARTSRIMCATTGSGRPPYVWSTIRSNSDGPRGSSARHT